ncbi:MAG: hypothetical protein HQK97_02515 [Nitrospirae bacterium]|nr:hypothetical protein [Nitrospirota bacterium]
MVNHKLPFCSLALALLLSVHSGQFAFAAEVTATQPGAAAPETAPEKRQEAVVVKRSSRSSLEKYLITAGGFIADDVQIYGKIVAAPAPSSERFLFGKNDYVYIDINQDYADQYTDYFIIEIGDKVKHPKTGKNMGKLISIIGQLRLIGQESGYKKALITESVREIGYKQPIIPAYAFQRPDDSETLKPSIGGIIIKVIPMHLLGAQYQIIYVDKGTDDGLKSGDMFVVMSTTRPVSPVGKIKILSTQKNTSTAYVIDSKTSIFEGDTF